MKTKNNIWNTPETLQCSLNQSKLSKLIFNFFGNFENKTKSPDDANGICLYFAYMVEWKKHQFEALQKIQEKIKSVLIKNSNEKNVIREYKKEQTNVKYD